MRNFMYGCKSIVIYIYKWNIIMQANPKFFMSLKPSPPNCFFTMVCPCV